MPDFDIEVFYDGACPLCSREIDMLRRRDRRGRIRFTDIAAREFDAATVGTSWDALMARIHGRLPDGTLVEGVEVFRRLYAAVGFARLVRLSRAPGLSHLLELGYHLFAKNRLRLTGRCEDGACAVHAPHPPDAPTLRRHPNQWSGSSRRCAPQDPARIVPPARYSRAYVVV
jgi:predicted DCC family thiol-disulfide oxidoreductase YuxK